MTSENAPIVEGFDNLRLIGRGGSAKVYQAKQSRLGRDVALKVLRGSSLGEQGRRLFEIERQILASLPKFPHIVSVYDGGFTADGDPWLAMELCPGGSLGELMRAQGPLDFAQVVRVGLRIASSLDFAHRRQLIHCDVKPENVLISELGEPVLSDFGISSVLGQETTGNEGLSPHHVAPEILRGVAASPASDLYSLGSTMYSLAVGRSPHQRERGERLGIAETFSRVLNEPSHELPAGVDASKSFRVLVRSLMTKDHTRRPAHAADVVAVLAAIEREIGTAGFELPLPNARQGHGGDERIPTLAPSIAASSAEHGDDRGDDVDDFATVHSSERFASRPLAETTAPRHEASPRPSSTLNRPGEDQSTGDDDSDGPIHRGHSTSSTNEVRWQGSDGSVAAKPVVGPVELLDRRKVLRILALGAAAVAMAAIGTRLLARGDGRDVADTAAVVRVTEVDVLAIRPPTIVSARLINETQAEVAWKDVVQGAVYSVELSRQDRPQELLTASTPVPEGSAALIVNDLQTSDWTPCFVVVARDPGTDRIERSAQSCASVTDSTIDTSGNSLP